RTLAGQAVALEDRCAHRSFPLSRSRLEGDGIVCGYHGFRYDSQGELIETPSQKACPRGVGIRHYPLLERGPLVWIWLGDPRLADPKRLPQRPWLEDPGWACSKG
ncbi:Rieske 2Fe-2S domain-containing protein, partial [Pseudomonas aeruginosa]|nr:Rieske 2Fe-2S domain-containing protein [Pseudomonas aeruginosa]